MTSSEARARINESDDHDLTCGEGDCTLCEAVGTLIDERNDFFNVAADIAYDLAKDSRGDHE